MPADGLLLSHLTLLLFVYWPSNGFVGVHAIYYQNSLLRCKGAQIPCFKPACSLLSIGLTCCALSELFFMLRAYAPPTCGCEAHIIATEHHLCADQVNQA